MIASNLPDDAANHGPGDGPGGATPQLAIGSPTDILATIPYLLGRPPARGMVILGVRGASVHIALTCDLGRTERPGPRLLGERAAEALHGEGCDAALAVGYGGASLVTPHMDGVRTAAAQAGIRIGEALRVTDGRYWSYVCPFPECCPPEGTVYNPDSSTVPATAVAHGLTEAPSRPEAAPPADRARQRAALAPVEGPARATIRRTTRRLERRAERLRAGRAAKGRDAFGARFRIEGVRAVLEAVQAAEHGDLPAAPDVLAWLGIVLTSIRVRDEVWSRIQTSTAPTHARLWAHVLRHVEDEYRAAPGALLAVAAWRSRDGALAHAALDAALEAAPGYSMALLMRQVLATGLPLEKWADLTPEWLEREWPLDEP